MGWQHLHLANDDHTRIAHCEVLAGQGAEHSGAFSRARSPSPAAPAPAGAWLDGIAFGGRADAMASWHARLWADTLAFLERHVRVGRPAP